MQKTLTLQEVDKKILGLKRQLLALGPFQPGSLSSQYHVCGKAGCQCRDPKKPRPHGPYTKLTYAYHGKFTCHFVRAEELENVTAMVANFKTFRQLTDKWIALAIQRARLGPLQRTAPRSKPRKTGPDLQKTPRRRKSGR